MLTDNPLGFDADPFAAAVDSTWVAYKCGWAIRVPVAEREKAPEECPICRAGRVDR
jgi:rubrerythrin